MATQGTLELRSTIVARAMQLLSLSTDFLDRCNRGLPAFRGKRRAYNLLRNAASRLGAQPIVVIDMNDGTRMRVDLRSGTEAAVFHARVYEPFLQEALLSLVRDGSTILDVGANIGFHTMRLCQHLRRNQLAGHVYAFEPHEGNYQGLLRNVEVNAFEDLVTAVNLGLSDEPGETRLTLREDFAQGAATGNASVSISHAYDHGFRQVPIKLESLDSIWKRLPGSPETLDLVKIDVEGHEDLCLKGARQTFERHRPTILIEVAKPYYLARNVDFNNELMAALPDRYSIYRPAGRWSGLPAGSWERIPSFAYCNELDNVFLVPLEKLAFPEYSIFVLSHYA